MNVPIKSTILFPQENLASLHTASRHFRVLLHFNTTRKPLIIPSRQPCVHAAAANHSQAPSLQKLPCLSEALFDKDLDSCSHAFLCALMQPRVQWPTRNGKWLQTPAAYLFNGRYSSHYLLAWQYVCRFASPISAPGQVAISRDVY